jgi:hypothetical protein
LLKHRFSFDRGKSFPAVFPRGKKHPAEIAGTRQILPGKPANFSICLMQKPGEMAGRQKKKAALSRRLYPCLFALT